MKHRSVYSEGEYTVWSGVEKAKGKGVFVVYWQGIEIERTRYLRDAQWAISAHKQKQYVASGKPAEKIKDNAAWVKDFERSLAAGTWRPS